MTEKQHERLLQEFRRLGQPALTYSHYQLAAASQIKNIDQWREFLKDQRTIDWISEEMKLIRNAKINAIQQNIDEESLNTAPAVLRELGEMASKARKTGPAWVFAHVPLNTEQQESPGAKQVQEYIKEHFTGGPKND